MLRLKDGIIELYRKVATSIPPDVETAIVEAARNEDDGLTLNIIIDNIKSARALKRPVCQDTGVPIFWIKLPQGVSQREITPIIIEATREATIKVPLRANAVDPLTELNSGDNTGKGFPIIFYEEYDGASLVIDLMLKGAGCENASHTYKLPTDDSVIGLEAHRDFEGVRRCIIDSVLRIQGLSCPPYTLGVAVGASKEQVVLLAKRQLLRKLNDVNGIARLAELEGQVLRDINSLGVGPIGLGGKATALGVKIAVNHRHPASYFVEVSVSCWALRRGKLIWS